MNNQNNNGVNIKEYYNLDETPYLKKYKIPHHLIPPEDIKLNKSNTPIINKDKEISDETFNILLNKVSKS